MNRLMLFDNILVMIRYQILLNCLELCFTQPYFSISWLLSGLLLEGHHLEDGFRYYPNKTKTVGFMCILANFINRFRYVTSIYFVSIVASTVGYGDGVNSGHNTGERSFLIFLEFAGILGFSLIIANVQNL